MKRPMKDLVDEPFHPKVKEKIKSIQLLIIDECYLTGSRLFSCLLRRIAKVKNKTFKNPSIDTLGVSIVCSGDDKQLSSPMDVCLNSEIKESYDEMTKEGLDIFSKAHYKFELKTILRQASDVKFMEILNNIRNNSVTESDVEALNERVDEQLSDTELSGFMDSVHIFSSNYLATKWNQTYLLTKNIPVRVVKPVLSIDCSLCASEYQSCYLGTGVRVSVTRNLCSVKSVVNGTECFVEDIFYANDTDVMPSFVTVHIPSYRGPALDDKTLPITLIKEKAFCVHSCKMFEVQYIPLRTNYGMTTYKAQSRTLDSVVVNFAGFKFKAIYSALSRCTRLDQVVIRSDFPLRHYFFSKN